MHIFVKCLRMPPVLCITPWRRGCPAIATIWQFHAACIAVIVRQSKRAVYSRVGIIVGLSLTLYSLCPYYRIGLVCVYRAVVPRWSRTAVDIPISFNFHSPISLPTDICISIDGNRYIKLTHVGFRAHVKLASRIVSYSFVELCVIYYSYFHIIRPCRVHRMDARPTVACVWRSVVCVLNAARVSSAKTA